jgi:hypothetical protein
VSAPRTLRSLLCAALLGLAAAPSVARADAKSDEASQHFKSGVAFYKDHDYAAALVEFKKAYELVPNYVVLFNLGQTARELKDYASALSSFEKFLADGGAKVTPSRRKTVQASIDELKQKVGTIKIATSVDGAEILLDDRSIGRSPLAAPVTVNVGRRKLSASLEGYRPVTREVDVASMAESAVTLDLAKIEQTPPVPPPEAAKPGIPVYNWISLSATGTTLLVTIVMGGLAISARSDLKTALGTFPGNPTAIADAQSRTRTFAVAADVLGGLTVAGALATGALFLFGPKGDKPKEPKVGLSPTGIVVQGTF